MFVPILLILFHLYWIPFYYLVESEMILLCIYSQFNIHRYIPHIYLYSMPLLQLCFYAIWNTRMVDSFYIFPNENVGIFDYDLG